MTRVGRGEGWLLQPVRSCLPAVPAEQGGHEARSEFSWLPELLSDCVLRKEGHRGGMCAVTPQQQETRLQYT